MEKISIPLLVAAAIAAIMSLHQPSATTANGTAPNPAATTAAPANGNPAAEQVDAIQQETLENQQPADFDQADTSADSANGQIDSSVASPAIVYTPVYYPSAAVVPYRHHHDFRPFLDPLAGTYDLRHPIYDYRADDSNHRLYLTPDPAHGIRIDPSGQSVRKPAVVIRQPPRVAAPAVSGAGPTARRTVFTAGF